MDLIPILVCVAIGLIAVLYTVWRRRPSSARESFEVSAARVHNELIEPVGADADAIIDQLSSVAKKHVELSQEHFGVELSYSGESFSKLDQMLDQWPSPPPANLEAPVMSFGSFIGECIIRLHGGRWTHNEEFGFHLTGIGETDTTAFPFSKVEKRIVNGEEDSLEMYYAVLCQLVESDEAEDPNTEPA